MWQLSWDRNIKRPLSWGCSVCAWLKCLPHAGLRIKETKEVYEGEVTELTPCETENPMGGYGKTISHVIIGLKTAKGTKQLKVRREDSAFTTYCSFSFTYKENCYSHKLWLNAWPKRMCVFSAGSQHLWESAEGACGSGRRHLHWSKQWSSEGRWCYRFQIYLLFLSLLNSFSFVSSKWGLHVYCFQSLCFFDVKLLIKIIKKLQLTQLFWVTDF